VDAFAFSHLADIHWSNPNNAFRLLTRSAIKPMERQELIVRVMPIDMTNEFQPPAIALMTGGQGLASIVIAYRSVSAGPKYQSVVYPFLSGSGADWAQYHLCTGAAPIGYHLDRGTVVVLSQCTDKDFMRDCEEPGMVCKALQKDDSDVCYSFDIQGYHHGADMLNGKVDKQLTVYVTLKATYYLNTPVMALSSIAVNRP
jgi:hypothetical protein